MDLNFTVYWLWIIRSFAGTGNTVIKAVSVLVENNVLEENILLLTLFSTPSSLFFHLLRSIFKVFHSGGKYVLVNENYWGMFWNHTSGGNAFCDVHKLSQPSFPNIAKMCLFPESISTWWFKNCGTDALLDAPWILIKRVMLSAVVLDERIVFCLLLK